MSASNGQLVPCFKCKVNPASALWQPFTKKGKKGRKLNLCAACGFSIATWIKMWTPPPSDEAGEQDRIPEPVFYHPYVRAEIIGPPDASFTQARSARKDVRAVPLAGAALVSALARFGLRG